MKKVVFNVVCAQTPISSSGGNVNNGFELQTSLQGLSKLTSTLYHFFLRISNIKVYSTHKLEIFNFFLHKIIKGLGNLVKKVNFVKFWLNCSNFYPIVTKLLFSCF